MEIFYYINSMDTQKEAKRNIVITSRHKLQANQKEFAEWLGVTPKYISLVERGAVPASAKLMSAIEMVLIERGIPDAVRSPEEAALLDGYRQLTPESRHAVDGTVAALLAAQSSATH